MRAQGGIRHGVPPRFLRCQAGSEIVSLDGLQYDPPVTESLERRVRRLEDRFAINDLVVAYATLLDDAQWDALQVPVGMAFFLRNSVQDRVIACYPSPAGATESELSLQAWTSGVGGGRLATELAPDVEALLVRRGKDARTDCLLVPIDACYRLVGLVRLHWRGFDGGADAWREIDRFFDDLRAAARPV